MKIFCIFLGGAAGSQPAQGEDCRRYGEGDDVRVNIICYTKLIKIETNQNASDHTEWIAADTEKVMNDRVNIRLLHETNQNRN